MDATPDDLPRPIASPGRSSPKRLGRTVGVLAFVGAAAAVAYAALLSSAPRSEPFAVAPIRNGDLSAEAGRRQAVAAPPPVASGKLAPAPDSRLIERTRFGLLPRIGADGAKPAQVYARPVAAAPGSRIALLVGGLGIGQNASAEAIAKLPPAVTLAFAPYGTDLDRLVTQAREKGHEVMLQVPMEPFDYPDNDPGPHTLTVRASSQENKDRLHWVMGRFTGYVGLVNVMGAKFTADEAALGPVVKEASDRGLVFLDDGSSVRSVTGSGAMASLPTQRAHLSVDATARADAIDRELQRLEDMARDKGLAIGTGSALPVTVERIALWAKALESKGVQLVPISSIYEARR